MIEGLGYLAARAVRRSILGPGKLRWYGRQTRPFVHRSRFGLTFELEPDQYVDRFILLDGIYEDRFLEFVAAKLPRSAVVLDIGANIGNHALFLARHAFAVHAFEPNPTALKRLRRNIALNRAGNVAVHPFAMGERDEVKTFYECPGNLGASSFVDATNGERKELPIRHADKAVAELGLSRLDFIKIDVEGMEEAVLAGLQETLARFRPIVAFEYHGDTRPASDFQKMRQLLPGYSLVEPSFSPPEGKLAQRIAWNVRKAGKPDIVPIHEPEPRWYENVLAMP